MSTNKNLSKLKTITICCSANFYKKALSVEKELKELGFQVQVPQTAYKMEQANNFDPSVYKTWYQNKNDYKVKKELMDDHFDKVLRCDAILVVNEEKHGIPGYIGGNTLMEMTLAYHYHKPIFIYNRISDKLNIAEEVFGVGPTFIDRDLSKIK